MKTTQETLIETKVEETSDAITHFFAIDRERSDWPISVLVSRAIERIADRPTDEIEPLAHCVDPDALDDLFTDRWGGQSRVGGEVTFSMDRYRVTVVADERIIVTEFT